MVEVDELNFIFINFIQISKTKFGKDLYGRRRFQ